jgi:hypothetical protein
MAWTQTDAHNLRRALAGLNPRATAGRPTAQATYDCLAALADKASRAIHGAPGALRDDQKTDLRQLVDDLYRVEPSNGPAVQCVSWDYREPPDMADLIAAITSVSGGQVHAREVDEGSQDYILVISRQPLDDAAALAAWEAIR